MRGYTGIYGDIRGYTGYMGIKLCVDIQRYTGIRRQDIQGYTGIYGDINRCQSMCGYMEMYGGYTDMTYGDIRGYTGIYEDI